MATSIRDRLQAKIKPAAVAKRTLTKSERKVLSGILDFYSNDNDITEQQIKLLRVCDDKKLVDSIFGMLEKDFKHTNHLSIKYVIAFIYKLQEKSLIEKLESYYIGVLDCSEIKKADGAANVIFYSPNIDFISKAIAAVPAKNKNVIEKLLNTLPKKYADIAIKQFLKPKYTFLPLLTLLEKNYLSRTQADTIIDSITSDGLEKRLKVSSFHLASISPQYIHRVAQKVAEVKWTYWRNYTKVMPLEMLVAYLLPLEPKPEYATWIQNNDEYLENRRGHFDKKNDYANSVFLQGLAKILRISVKDYTDYYEWDIK